LGECRFHTIFATYQRIAGANGNYHQQKYFGYDWKHGIESKKLKVKS
jgi:hypothetical protein